MTTEELIRDAKTWLTRVEAEAHQLADAMAEGESGDGSIEDMVRDGVTCVLARNNIWIICQLASTTLRAIDGEMVAVSFGTDEPVCPKHQN